MPNQLKVINNWHNYVKHFLILGWYIYDVEKMFTKLYYLLNKLKIKTIA